MEPPNQGCLFPLSFPNGPLLLALASEVIGNEWKYEDWDSNPGPID